MLKPIKVKCAEEDLFFVSDYHHGHDKPFILGPRGFTTVAEHDTTLQTRWNAHLNNDTSIAFSLGDLMMGADEAKFWLFCRTHNFKHLYLLWGNHPSGQSAAYKSLMKARFPDSTVADQLLYEVYPLTHDLDGTGRLVTFLPTFVELSACGERFSLCHYAIAAHHKQGNGAYHLCGHSHGSLPFTNVKTGQGLRLDVGIESFGRPVSLTQIKRHLAGRALDLQDHHRESKDVENTL
jgi:calcineurin-like phosphoesterase family protein